MRGYFFWTWTFHFMLRFFSFSVPFFLWRIQIIFQLVSPNLFENSSRTIEESYKMSGLSFLVTSLLLQIYVIIFPFLFSMLRPLNSSPQKSFNLCIYSPILQLSNSSTVSTPIYSWVFYSVLFFLWRIQIRFQLVTQPHYQWKLVESREL